MSLGDRINEKFEEWRQNISQGLAAFMVTVTGRGIELVLDIVGKAMKPAMLPTINKLLDTPNLPADVKSLLTQLKTTDGQWQTIVMGSLAGGTLGGTSSAVLFPALEILKQTLSAVTPFQLFDYPIVLAAWLRGLDYPIDIFNELRYRGWDDVKIELLKKLVWLRLDPLFVQQIWLRDNSKYEHLWKDLKDMGWDEERVEVYKELAHIIPPLPDMTRFADFGAFDPEIIAAWQQFYDAPSWIKEPMAKIGITGDWANKYWFSHWRQPGRYELGLMRRRDYINDDTVKKAYLTQGYSSFWQDLLLKLVWEPYTRVDVRRMYKVGVLDENGLKRAYRDLGYDEEKAARLTDFTIKYYGRDEDDVEEEEEKVRELTRSDVCDGYRRGILSREEAAVLLGGLAYTDPAIQFYLDREDLKKDQALKDAYATNYRRLFVTGVMDADKVASEMGDLGFLPGEVDEYLRVWYIEKLRREARPSRTDLTRFMKKEIITEEQWRQGMADLGYADMYIEWYLEDTKV